MQSPITAVLLLFLGLAGCATTARSPNFSSAHVYLDQAEGSATGETLTSIKKAKTQLVAAEQACKTNTDLLDKSIRELNEQVGKAEYWKEKQRKALKELWIYRGAIIALVLWVFRGWIFSGVGFVARKFIGVPW